MEKKKALYEESHSNIVGTPTDEIESTFNESHKQAEKECYVCGKSDCEFYLKNLRKRAREPIDEKKYREAMRIMGQHVVGHGVDWKDKIESIEEAREALTDKWDELCDIEKEQPFPLKIKFTVEITPKDGIEKLYELVDTLKDILKTINKPKEA